MPLHPQAPSRGGRHLPLVTDLSAWDRVLRAIAGSRVQDLLDLIRRDQLVALPPGTALAIEEDLATLIRVRVLDGAQAARSGWLPRGLVPGLVFEREAA